jgi:hypothetical protein
VRDTETSAALPSLGSRNRGLSPDWEAEFRPDNQVSLSLRESR